MFHFEETKLLKCNHFLTRNTTQIYTLEYNDNVHIYSEKTAASYDNRRTAILSVFIFADGGAGVGIHTTVHIQVVYPVPATVTRFPWITFRQLTINNLLAPKPTPKPSSNPNPSSSKKTKTDMKLPKCQCTAEQYHLFDICCF